MIADRLAGIGRKAREIVMNNPLTLKVRDWVQDWRLDRVGLYVLTFDAEAGVFHEDFNKVPRAELPPEAVHVTGKGSKEWYLDQTNLARFPKERELTAIYADLWRQNNFISEAFAEKWTSHLDIKQLGIILVAGAVAVFVAATIYL